MPDFAEIRARTRSKLLAQAIPLHPHLPLRDERDLRTPADVAKRVVVLYGLAGLVNGADHDAICDWLRSEGAWDYLADGDRVFLDGHVLAKSERNLLSWKQESLFALAWSGGMCASLPGLGSEANLDPIFPLIPPEVGMADFVGSFRLRSQAEIIAELDHYYCVHAALRHAELWAGGVVPAGINRGCVMERRRALEWLCRPGEEWDEITLDT